jgi:hypothetical protein
MGRGKLIMCACWAPLVLPILVIGAICGRPDDLECWSWTMGGAVAWWALLTVALKAVS